MRSISTRARANDLSRRLFFPRCVCIPGAMETAFLPDTVPRYRIDSAARRAEMYLFRRCHYYFGGIRGRDRIRPVRRNRPVRYSENWNGRPLRDFADNSEN